MKTISEMEAEVWNQIDDAMRDKNAGKLKYFSALAQDIDEKKAEWDRRLRAFATGNGASSSPGISLRRVEESNGTDYTSRPIRGFELLGKAVSVPTYKTLLIEVAEALRQKHGAAFDAKALQLSGRMRRYFSNSPGDLKYAHELSAGGIFVETNLNANLIVKICRDLVRELGHDSADLRIHDHRS